MTIDVPTADVPAAGLGDEEAGFCPAFLLSGKEGAVA
jgi:hypothetical protein